MKAYTDLEQSKKLAEILPLENADMRFCFSHTLSGRIIGHYPMIGREPSSGTIPCWSLAALLGVIPKHINDYPKGKKAWCFKLYYGKAIKRFKWVSWVSTTKDVWWQRVNSYPFRFIGIMILPNEDVYDLSD